jgi:arabinosaccharide transport system substrate-binding protein
MRKMSVMLIVALIALCFTSGFSAKRNVVMWTFAANNKQEWDARKASIEKQFDITLDVQLVAQDAFVQKLQAVMMDGKGVPDIVEWLVENNRILNANPANSFVIPLDDYVKNSDAFKQLVPGRVAWQKYGSHVYGLPHDVHPLVLIYNDTLWKKAGVDVATLKSWDDFFAAAKKLTKEKKDGKTVHFALPSQNGTLGDTMFMIWQTTGANILDKEGKPTFTSPEFSGFMKKWKGWYDSGAFVMWDWGNFGALLKNGTLASYISPDWWVSQVDQAALSNNGVYQFKVRDLPYYVKGGPTSGSWGGSFMAIPKGTTDPAFIYKIIEFCQTDKDSLLKIRFPLTGMIPPFAGVWNDPVFDKADPRFGGIKLAQLQISQAKKMPSIQSGDIFWDAINDFAVNYPGIMTGQMTIDEGLQKVQADALKRYTDLKK